MSKRVKIDLVPVTETTEVNSNEKIQKETLLVDDSISSGEVSKEQTVETKVEIGTKETIKESVIKPIVTEEKSKSKKTNIDFEGRGFSSIEEALDFPNTKYFKGLGKEDKEEYLNWLKK